MNVFFSCFTEVIINDDDSDEKEKNQEETDKIDFSLMFSGTQGKGRKKSSVDSDMGKKSIDFFYIYL